MRFCEESIEWFNLSLKHLRPSASRPEMKLRFTGRKTVFSSVLHIAPQQDSLWLFCQHLTHNISWLRAVYILHIMWISWEQDWCKTLTSAADVLCAWTLWPSAFALMWSIHAAHGVRDCIPQCIALTWPSVPAVINDSGRNY